MQMATLCHFDGARTERDSALPVLSRCCFINLLNYKESVCECELVCVRERKKTKQQPGKLAIATEIVNLWGGSSRRVARVQLGALSIVRHELLIIWFYFVSEWDRERERESGVTVRLLPLTFWSVLHCGTSEIVPWQAVTVTAACNTAARVESRGVEGREGAEMANNSTC